MCKHWLIVLSLLAPMLLAQQPTDSIEIGGHRLKLGMPRDQVISQLSRAFEISGGGSKSSPCIKTDSGCTLWPKETQPPFRSAASIAFKDGRLDTVVKYWGPENQQQSVPYARALFAAIESLVKDGKTTCRLSAHQKATPGNEDKVAYITCGGRSIGIDVDRDDKYGEFATVSEWLTR